MDAKILFGRILQILIDQGFSQVEGYNRFNYISHTSNFALLDRESGEPTKIYFSKVVEIIEHYQKNPEDYDVGPGKTREYGLTHLNSPIWSLLHLLDKDEYIK